MFEQKSACVVRHRSGIFFLHVSYIDADYCDILNVVKICVLSNIIYPTFSNSGNVILNRQMPDKYHTLFIN